MPLTEVRLYRCGRKLDPRLVSLAVDGVIEDDALRCESVEIVANGKDMNWFLVRRTFNGVDMTICSNSGCRFFHLFEIHHRDVKIG